VNIKEFFTAPKTYHGGDNPLNASDYDRASAEWDKRTGEVAVQNYNLRRLLLLSMVVILTLAGGLITQSLKATVVPYVVEVDSTTGIVKNVGLAQAQVYEPQEAQIKYFLSQFVRNIRALPLDPVVYKQNLDTAYGFLTKQAGNKMSVMLQDENPIANLGKQTVQIEIGVMLPLADGSKSYQIRWQEERYDLNSGVKKAINMSGIFTIALKAPTDRQTLDVNPLGIYITDFSWAQEEK
jgi:type IV secretion system protein VirB5